MFPRVFLLIFLTCVIQTAGAVEPLRSLARIRALSPEAAAQALPVAIEVSVTFYDPPRPSLLAHDGSEGIFVQFAGSLKVPPQFGVGTRLRIEGVTQPGGFLPIVEARQLTVLGSGSLPSPRRINGSEIFSPSLDCQWVEVPAVITGVEKSGDLVLVAEVSGWTVKLLTPHNAQTIERATELMQRPVLVRGVVGTVFNDQRQLTARHFFVPSFDQIIPIENSQPDEEPQLRAINELLRSDANSRTRVRVRGTVTHAAGDGIYLRGEGGSVFVRTANPGDFAPGMQVEAEGFAVVASFRPHLRASRVTILTRGATPLPEPLDLSRENIVRQQAELVTIDADFLTRRDGPGQQAVLQCRRDKWYFEALIGDRSTLPRELAANDRLRLTGICELTTTRTLPFASSVDGFRLLLRRGDDIAILRSAPWWTLRRLLWALGLIGTLAVAAIVWVALLRRRVAEQTRIIGEQIERAVIKDERQRIARELHDTIEQELAGLSIQLRNARQRLANDPEQAGTAIELAQRMLRHCRNEARTSIRDLRSVALEQRGLPGALDELLTPLVAESSVRLVLNVEGAVRSLAGPVEIHLLRIAQQAVANAMQHAAPREICVQLSYAVNEVTLKIRDDGCGFDSGAPAPRGHFGVLGIRERANKIHGQLSLESAPGAGTTICVVIPADAATPGNGHSL